MQVHRRLVLCVFFRSFRRLPVLQKVSYVGVHLVDRFDPADGIVVAPKRDAMPTFLDDFGVPADKAGVASGRRVPAVKEPQETDMKTQPGSGGCRGA